MGRILGIDYGRKRTGLAVSDPLGVFASALDTIHPTKLIQYIKNYSETVPLERFVVGWPVNMDGSPSEAQADVKAFLVQLGKHFPDIPVEKEDERFTSVLAHRAMIDGGMKAKDRRDKASVDRISASIILQGWLDRRNSKEGDGTSFEAIDSSSPREESTGEGAQAPRPRKRKFTGKVSL